VRFHGVLSVLSVLSTRPGWQAFWTSGRPWWSRYC